MSVCPFFCIGPPVAEAGRNSRPGWQEFHFQGKIFVRKWMRRTCQIGETIFFLLLVQSQSINPFLLEEIEVDADDLVEVRVKIFFAIDGR